MEFKSPELKDVLSRVSMVCDKEGIKIDNEEMTEFCLNLNCDMRSILNNLQFYKNGISTSNNTHYIKRVYNWIKNIKRHYDRF